eukprot:scaffold22817_cov34-Attheya_sp.AAC.1
MGHDAAVRLFKTRRKPSLSIDSGAMPSSKMKHLGATDCDNEAKYHKNRGEDADAKKKTSEDGYVVWKRQVFQNEEMWKHRQHCCYVGHVSL